MPSKPPIHLFLDWDGTTTLTDTLSLIAGIGYTKKARRELPPWSHFTTSYASDYSAHTASYVPQIQDRQSVAQELAWLESLIDVERASIERVEAAGIFAKVTPQDVQAAAIGAVQGEEVRLRAGLRELVEAMERRKACAYIVSVNWSATFILQFLKSASTKAGWCWPFDEVYANEIEAEGIGKLNRVWGKENRGIWTAGDKSRVLKGVMSMYDQGEMSVYIGDSLTDLDCLLSADVGICVRDDPMASEQKSLAETLVRLEIAVVWIGEYGLPNECQNGFPVVLDKTLWWARDLKEVAESHVFIS